MGETWLDSNTSIFCFWSTYLGKVTFLWSISNDPQVVDLTEPVILRYHYRPDGFCSPKNVFQFHQPEIFSSKLVLINLVWVLSWRWSLFITMNVSFWWIKMFRISYFSLIMFSIERSHHERRSKQDWSSFLDYNENCLECVDTCSAFQFLFYAFTL